MSFTIKGIRNGIKAGEYYFSKHGDQERQNDGLSVFEIEEAVDTGTILELYPDTGRGASCLMAGFTRAGKPVHLVFGRHGKQLVIVTVYIPVPPKFITPYQRGNE